MPDADEFRETIMARPDLENLAHFDLPEGFSLRSYQAGDEVAWLDIHRRADLFNTFTPHTFEQQFGHDAQVLGARQKYLRAPDGSLIGTASAWADDLSTGSTRGEGRVHWVAIVPEFQGRGLGKPLVSAILYLLRDLGHTSAILSTDERRPAAIALYKSLGFHIV